MLAYDILGKGGLFVTPAPLLTGSSTRAGTGINATFQTSSALGINIWNQMNTSTLFVTYLNMSIVRYLSIFKGELLDYFEESTTVALIRIMTILMVLTCCILDYNFSSSVGMGYGLFGDPKYEK